MGIAKKGESDPGFRYPGRPPVRQDARGKLLAEGNESTLRSLISGGRLEGLDGKLYEKPDYLFGDTSIDDHPSLCTMEDIWLSKVGEDKFYLPTHRRHYPLSFFLPTTTGRRMAWRLTYTQNNVSVGVLTTRGHNRDGLTMLVTGLHPGLRCGEARQESLLHK